MALAQMRAVTGRRIKPRIRDIIEAQAPYVHERYRLRKSADLQERGLELDEERLALEEAQARRNAALAKESLEEEKKQARRANLISVGNLGLKTGLGAYNVFSDRVGGDDAAGGIPTSTPSTELDSKLSFDVPETSGSVTPFLSKSGILDTSRWKGALTSGKTYGAGGLGVLASRTVGRDQSPATRALIGGGIGGLAGAIFSKGDPYSAVLSGIVGGLGGLF